MRITDEEKEITLKVKNLTKQYGSHCALSKLTLTFHPGVYGILGANGAGKSTFMNLLTDNIVRDYGDIWYNGVDILRLGTDFRKHVGYMPQQQGFYDHFSAKMFLLYMAKLKNIPQKKAKTEVEQLLQKVNLAHVSKEKIGGFSGGMRQRLLLAQALLGNPQILILDEPTAGLDPKERINIRNLISELSANKIILYATHVVNDIECIADQVLLMKKGKLIDIGSPEELISKLEGKVGERICVKQELPELTRLYPTGNVIQRKTHLAYRIVTDQLPEGFEVVKEDLNLEDVYLYFIGNADESQ